MKRRFDKDRLRRSLEESFESSYLDAENRRRAALGLPPLKGKQRKRRRR
jgi:hypothetical protein